jgi:hypothetical protein
MNTNNSVLTQRVKSCTKDHHTNPEISDKTMRLKESHKKILKAKTSFKKDKKAEYIHKKAKDINEFVENKLSVKTSRKSQNRSKSAFNSVKINN